MRFEVRRSLTVWAIVLAASLALGGAAAFLPARVRLLGLFAVAQGAAAGWLAAAVQARLRPGVRLRWPLAAAAAVVLQLTAFCGTWLRVDDSLRRRPYTPAELMSRQLHQAAVEAAQAESPEVRAQVEQMLPESRWRRGLTFSEYVAQRYAVLRDRGRFWPWAVAAAELLAGLAAAVVVSKVVAPREDSAAEA